MNTAITAGQALGSLDPDEAFLDVRIEVQLKDPAAYDAATGELLAMPAFTYEWDRIAFALGCDHCESACAECVDTWAIDHFVRITFRGQLVWASADAPAEEG